jgi:formamidopyrimidine-DNA glycosylase
MPEIPDLTVYLEALAERTVGTKLCAFECRSPFLLRTAIPPAKQAVGLEVRGIRRLGKRLVFAFEGEFFLVLHLMIAGRLHWLERTNERPLVKKGGRIGQALAIWHFERGTLWLTEAGTKKRASLYAVVGEDELRKHDPGGAEYSKLTLESFDALIRSENHTLKRTLTDPTIFAGIGNAYSDEILHRAKLSPVKLSQRLEPSEIEALYRAIGEVLAEWTLRLRQAAQGGFPEKVTAFHPEMAVHGRWNQPCPRCQTSVQRIRYATNETNYCPTCQTQGKVLADRALSRLLGSDWPRTVEELENRRRGGKV